MVLRLLALAALAVSISAHAEEGGGRKKRIPPQEFGRVVLGNQARRARVPPVVFDHWLHRAKYTCRVCHVDAGFAMKAGGTDVRAADNAAGQYCGACHNDRTAAPGGGKIFGSCKPGGHVDGPQCMRCHSDATDPRRTYDFATFVRDLPRARFGNGVDWEKAEEKRLVKPVDFVEGLSVKRPPMPVQKDFAVAAKLQGMPGIVFSHAKHTVWSGCEGCHPEIFKGVKRGATKYTMVEIFDGQYCGACHVSVAFPASDCQRCHTVPVQ